MKAYKGFTKDLKCRNFQFEEGKTYEEDDAKLCERGFHACLNPMDCWRYYGIIDSVYHEVELDGVSEECQKEDSKIVARKITVGARLDIAGMVKGTIDFVFSAVREKKGDSAQLASSGENAKLASSGDSAQLASSGENANLASSGDFAQLASSGENAQLASSGDFAQLASSGDFAQLASSGENAQLASSGYSAQMASSGDFAQLASSGENAQLASSGYFAQLASSGENAQLASSGENAKLASSGYSAQMDMQGEHAVGAAIGPRSIIRGKIGSWITLAEYDVDNNPICVKSARIDGEKLKPDTWYRLENGEFVEVEN